MIKKIEERVLGDFDFGKGIYAGTIGLGVGLLTYAKLNSLDYLNSSNQNYTEIIKYSLESSKIFIAGIVGFTSIILSCKTIDFLFSKEK